MAATHEYRFECDAEDCDVVEVLARSVPWKPWDAQYHVLAPIGWTWVAGQEGCRVYCPKHWIHVDERAE